MAPFQIKDLILYIWEFEDKWNMINDPQIGVFGHMTFRRLNDHELAESVATAEKIKSLKRSLRKSIGIWKYIRYSMNPLKFYKKNYS